jgi:hypothetical protein
MVKVMDGLNSMPWTRLGPLANGWTVEGTHIPPRDRFKYGYDLWSNGLAFEAFGIGRTYKVTIRAPEYGDGLWLFNFDTQGRAVNVSYTGTYWGTARLPNPELKMDFRLLPYPRYRPEMHRLIGGTWLRAKWTDNIDRSGLNYRAEILRESDPFYQAAMATLDEFVRQCMTGGLSADSADAAELIAIYRTLPVRHHLELQQESARFHGILQTCGDIPVEPPELAYDHYHAIPLKVQHGCGGPCTFCSLYDRRIRILSEEDTRRQIDDMAGYLGEELDHFSKVVLLEGDALTVPSEQLATELHYARQRFAIEHVPFAHAFAKASTVMKRSRQELQLLKDSGLLNVNFGLESGSQELLDLVKRGQNLSEFHDTVALLREIGINVSINIICGLGGVEFRDRHIEETVKFVQSLPPGTKVFYSTLQISPTSRYARKQSAMFGGEVATDDIDRDKEKFARELGAAEYLFVPM